MSPKLITAASFMFKSCCSVRGLLGAAAESTGVDRSTMGWTKDGGGDRGGGPDDVDGGKRAIAWAGFGMETNGRVFKMLVWLMWRKVGLVMVYKLVDLRVLKCVGVIENLDLFNRFFFLSLQFLLLPLLPFIFWGRCC